MLRELKGQEFRGVNFHEEAHKLSLSMKQARKVYPLALHQPDGSAEIATAHVCIVMLQKSNLTCNLICAHEFTCKLASSYVVKALFFNLLVITSPTNIQGDTKPQLFHWYSCKGLHAAAVPPPTVAQAFLQGMSCYDEEDGKQLRVL
eukprot:1157607-Pelagomonas_calceolata.AAC.1